MWRRENSSMRLWKIKLQNWRHAHTASIYAGYIWSCLVVPQRLQTTTKRQAVHHARPLHRDAVNECQMKTVRDSALHQLKAETSSIRTTVCWPVTGLLSAERKGVLAGPNTETIYHTQRPIQWILSQLTSFFQLVQKSRMVKLYVHFPHTPPWRGV